MSKSNKKVSSDKKSKQEKNREYCKEWYKNNKDKHKEYIRTKIICDCGTECNRSSLSRHIKSKAHQEWEENGSKLIECKCGGRYAPDLKYKHMTCKKHQDYLKAFQ